MHRLLVAAFCLLAACEQTSDLPAFPVPASVPPTTLQYSWAFYDTPDNGTVFKNFAPQQYLRFSAKQGSTWTIELTAMKSSEDWVADPSKQLDGALLEGTTQGDAIVWKQLARTASVNGVLTLTGTSSGDELVHLVGVEAAAASYDPSISPAVEYTFTMACAGASHAECALGGEPGDACTVSPDTCDGPFQACSASVAGGNVGTCVRTDVVHPGGG